MSLKNYQQQIDKALQPLEQPYWHPLSQLARIIEEVGETSRIINNKYGDKKKKLDERDNNLADELADILFGVMCLANQEGIDLDEPMERTIQKLRDRDIPRYQKKNVST